MRSGKNQARESDAVLAGTAELWIVTRAFGGGLAADRAVAWLHPLGQTLNEADVPEEKADLLHAIHDRIVVAGRSIKAVRLTPAAYAHGMALVLPEEVVMARPAGAGRAITYRLPIEGREEWVEAARAGERPA